MVAKHVWGAALAGALTGLLLDRSLNLHLLLDINRVPTRSPGWDVLSDVGAQQLIYVVAVLWAASLVWCLWGRRFRDLTGLLAVPAGAELLSLVAAMLRPEQRPFTATPLVHRLISHGPGQSFPSDHATAAFALAAACWVFADRRLGTFMTVLAVLIGLSRVAAGVHYPADVVAGACCGLVSAAAVRLLWRRADHTTADGRTEDSQTPA
jgi:undecaprenyl-diphosphatase